MRGAHFQQPRQSPAQSRTIAIDKRGNMDEVSVTIQAAPEQVWALVIDITG